MARIRASVVALGALLLVIISIVGTYFVLLSTGSIKRDGVDLEITIADAEKIYDGKPLEASNYEITSGSLLKGDSIEIDYLGSQTDVGYSKSDASVKVVNADEYNVTNEYNIRVKKGNLTIKKREITVKAKDEQIKYSGNDLTGTDYEIVAGSLALGHKLVPSFKTVTIDDATSKGVSELDALVLDAIGNDVSKNYDMTFIEGTVTLDKIALNIRTLPLSKEYDGTPLDSTNYSYELINSTMPSDCKIDVEFENVSVVNVEDSALLTIKNVKIWNAKGDNITNNYVINPINVGKLSITPHRIDIILDESHNVTEYSGEDFYNKEYTIEGEESNESFTYSGKLYKLNLVDYTKITNASSVQNKLTFEIENENGEDVTSNFDINQTTSILTITKKNLIIYGENITVSNSDDEEKLKADIQDELDLSKGAEGLGYEDKEYASGLINGHYAYLKYIIPNIQEDKNEYALAYSVVIKDKKDVDGADITFNYNISSIYGELFLKKKYALHFNNVEVQYNGEKIDFDELNFTCKDIAGNLVSNDLVKNNLTFDIKSTGSSVFPNVGEYELEAKLINNDVDYSIDSSTFKYTVTNRKTNINGERYKHQYTGSAIEFLPQSVLDNNITTDKKIISNLAPNEYLEIKYSDPFKTDIGIYDVEFQFKIYNSNGIETTSNYEVENVVEAGKLEIEKAIVNVTILNSTFVYDGTKHNEEVKYIVSAEISEIEESVKNNIVIVKFGETNAIDLKDAGTYNVSAYIDNEKCELNITPGIVTINKADVLIITTTEVSNNAVVVGDAEINSNLFKKEFTVETVTLNYVGSIANSIEEIRAKNISYKLSNYNLTIILGTLTKTA